MAIRIKSLSMLGHEAVMICRAHAAFKGWNNLIHRRAGKGSDPCRLSGELSDVALWSSVIEPRRKVRAMLFIP